MGVAVSKTFEPEAIETVDEHVALPPPGFLSTLFGLLFYPGETLPKLLHSSSEIPVEDAILPRVFPHVPSILLALLAAIFIPMFVQVARWDFLDTRIDEIFALLFVLILTGGMFVILERFALRCFVHEPMNSRTIFALMAYGCAPLIPLVLIGYAVNYWMFGRLTIVTFMITGVPNANDPTMKLFPVLHLIGKLLFLYTFYHGIRTERRLYPESAFFITIFSAIPFYLGLIISLYFIDAIMPGSVEASWMLTKSVVKLVGL